MNLRMFLGVALGAATGVAAAAAVVGRLQRASRREDEGVLPLDLDVARRMFRNEASLEAGIAGMMQYFEREFPRKDDQ